MKAEVPCGYKEFWPFCEDDQGQNDLRQRIDNQLTQIYLENG